MLVFISVSKTYLERSFEVLCIVCVFCCVDLFYFLWFIVV